MNQIDSYLSDIRKEYSHGNATEHTYRPSLKTLIESFDSGITAINEPQRRTFGAPDYVIRRRNIPLGYIEAKDIGRLGKFTKTEKEQKKRYLEALDNLIYTDYVEFHWYVRGELVQAVKIAKAANGKISPLKGDYENFENLIKRFLAKQIETVASAKELAKRMASTTRLIRQTIGSALKDNSNRSEDSLYGQLKSFQETLLPNLAPDGFADLYSQTIAYGLFTARCYDNKKPFTREKASYAIPKTNPFLRQIFDRIGGINLDERIVWAVDDLAELLNRTDMSAILQDFGKRTRREDPVVHFYETFLAAYDQKLREKRGVYYTPEPVVSYIVRSVDKVLKEEFRLLKGLADSSKLEDGTHKTLILDPAAGTGTFLYNVIKHIAKSYEDNEGMWDGYVSAHLLPRIFGFELLVAPYAVAHLKLGLLLKETGCDLEKEERLQVYLNNTLDFARLKENPGAFSAFINEEASKGREIQQDKPVMAILGNPPYAGHSANTGKWINGLLRGSDSFTEKPTENYFKVDGKPLGERNPKMLNDDYVKFIRFAQWRIDQTGYGVLAFITNHGYLDNPTFRGMRQSLMKSFDKVYLLDLHGNAKKKEKSPDGSKDENVFDIQQGVAIGIFIKKKSSEGLNSALSAGNCKVSHKHLYGVREIWTKNVNGENELTGGKYKYLNENDISTTNWTEIKPSKPFYLFIPQDETFREEYEKGWKINDVFQTNGVGITTARDKVVVGFEPNKLLERAKFFRDSKLSDAETCKNLNIPLKKGWNYSDARKEIKEEKDITLFIQSFAYRPFDNRKIFYHDSLVWRTVRDVMENFFDNNNLALCSLRRPRNKLLGNFYVTNEITDKCIISSLDNAQVFPLYLYPTGKKTLVDEEIEGRKPNFSEKFVAEFSEKLQLEFVSNPEDEEQIAKNQFTPEDIFYYAYAVFHSPTYRLRYAEFLKIDFPRLPLTSNQKLFRELAKHGQKLVELHLLKKEIETDVTFPEKGTNKVDFAPKYKDEKVYINKEQYFANVPKEAWNFHIGGYQVLHKWLKDRKGRELSFDELEHYSKVVSALLQTIELMSFVDEAIKKEGGFPIS